TPGAVSGTVVAQGYTLCNTVPAGVGVGRLATRKAGRIFAAWIAADLAQNATGCNVTMLQSFHTMWISYSDDSGRTWTPQQAFDAGFGHDSSTPFVSFTLDTAGNPYFGFAINLNSNPAACSAESTAGTVQFDTSCEYDMYVVWSSNGGATWDGGGGLIPGSAATAYRVNPVTERGTHFFPAIAAGNPGQVDVAYLRTTEILPTDPFGKADPGGCAGPGPANGNPTTYPPACSWNLYAAQSLNLKLAPRPGDVGGDADHHDTCAHRRHLQPGHLLPGAELQPQPARLHHGDHRPERLRAHRVRGRQHRQQAASGQPDLGHLHQEVALASGGADWRLPLQGTIAI